MASSNPAHLAQDFGSIQSHSRNVCSSPSHGHALKFVAFNSAIWMGFYNSIQQEYDVRNVTKNCLRNPTARQTILASWSNVTSISVNNRVFKAMFAMSVCDFRIAGRFP